MGLKNATAIGRPFGDTSPIRPHLTDLAASDIPALQIGTGQSLLAR